MRFYLSSTQESIERGLEEKMFQKIIEDILATHDDFSYEELEEICQDFYDQIPAKIKHETKLKRVAKYMKGEFELDDLEASLLPLGVPSHSLGQTQN